MGPLTGTKIVEIAGIGPGPFCGMVLADLGAELILVERKSTNPNAVDLVNTNKLGDRAIFNRGKQSISIDLKKPEGVEVVFDLVANADGLIEGFRPGVMERLGLGPEICLDRNPALVYGRITGWGQSGPLSAASGHDINYIALSGALHYAGHSGEAPFTPTSVVGDTGGGGLLLALGVVSAILYARQSGKGQILDAAITDGSAYLTSLMHVFYQTGDLRDERGSSFADGAAPWYDSYECADGTYVSIGSLEPKFYELLLEKCGLSEDPVFAAQFDQGAWPAAKTKMKDLFRSRTRDQWSDLLEGTDVCFAPVLDFSEAPQHPHNKHRKTYISRGGINQPAPAPRFSLTPSEVRCGPPIKGSNSVDVLRSMRYSDKRIQDLIDSGVVERGS